MKNNHVTFFLVFLLDHEQPGGFSHRFISHGGDEYIKSVKEWKRVRGQTSYDGLESLSDFLFQSGTAVSLNLSWLSLSFLWGALIHHGKKVVSFRSKEIEEALKLKVNTLHYYVQSGAITPEIDKGEGTGRSRIFSETNFMEAVIIKQLMDFGLPKKSIVSMMKSIQDANERHLLNPRRCLEDHAGK